MKKWIFLISPVRKVPSREVEWAIAAYVTAREREGYIVHWPKRDTDQKDPVGLRICSDNRAAIARADEVHIWWDKDSEGSKFDIGMLFMALYTCGPGKKVVIANPEAVHPTESKSFTNVLLALAEGKR